MAQAASGLPSRVAVCRQARRILLAGLVLAVATLTGTPSRAQSAPPSFADLVERVGAAVVNVSTRKEAAAQPDSLPQVPQFPPGSPFEEFFKDFLNKDKEKEQQAPRRAFSLGSGFIIDPRGFVVTNNHVIADADEITVTLHDDREYPAKLVGRDTKTDLALLKVDRPGEDFSFVAWADSDKVRVGDWMVAIGNPFGLGTSVTAGIVSARGRDIRSGPYDDFFQVDAAINRGNSGGPSFTPDGQVFGINTAIFSPTGTNVGIGFAIPSNIAKNVIDSLMQSGKVARGWLGVRIQNVTEDLAESLGLKAVQGALVASVTPGGPAEKGQIQAGDVVLQFDHKQIDRMRSLPRVVAETPIGREVDVHIWRKGQEQDLKITTGELPEDEQVADLGQPAPPSPTAQAKIDPLGVTVSPITPELKTQFSLADTAKGVVITEVVDGSPAAGENLRPGDLIVEVGQEPVSSAPEVLAKIGPTTGADDKRSVLLLIDRQGDLRFIALRLKA